MSSFVHDPRTSAVVVVDMWDGHQCPSIASRSRLLAHKINGALPGLRAHGYQIIFCAQGTDVFHQGLHRSQFMHRRSSEDKAAREFSPPSSPRCGRLRCECDPEIALHHGPYASDRMSPLIGVEPGDIILGGGGLGGLSGDLGIRSLLYCGQAANMCILTRPFGLIKMTQMGLGCALIGDLSLSILLRAGMSTNDEHALILEHYRAHVAPVVDVADLIT